MAMSDISFDGLGAFLVYLTLLVLLGIILLASFIALLRTKTPWTRHRSFGYFAGSLLATFFTLILIYITETGKIELKEAMDTWSLGIAILLLAVPLFWGYRHRMKIRKSNLHQEKN